MVTRVDAINDLEELSMKSLKLLFLYKDYHFIFAAFSPRNEIVAYSLDKVDIDR